MPELLERLIADHRTTERLLDLIEHEIFAASLDEPMDLDLIGEAMQYFRGYPDRVHHPLESALYRRLARRRPDQIETLGDILDEHDSLRAHVTRFGEAVDAVLAEAEIGRDEFLNRGKTFVESYRRHLTKEEKRLFPAVTQGLLAEDWTVSAREIAGADRVPDEEMAAFATLQRRLLTEPVV